MERTFIISLLTLLLVQASCSREGEDIRHAPDSAFVRTVGLSLSADTRAGDLAIAEATLFVYQTADEGEPVLYGRLYTTETADIRLDLIFSSQIDYTYTINAFGNMGDLAEEPDVALFSGESADGMQCFGTAEDIGMDDSVASVIMSRYVSRFVVNSVSLDWNRPENALADFTLKRIWLADVSDRAGGGPAYNVGGVCSATDMDALLMCEVNAVIGDGETCDVSRTLYGYGTPETALVFECEWGGRTMYYHIGKDSRPNVSYEYDICVFQTGSAEPLGDVTDEGPPLLVMQYDVTDTSSATKLFYRQNFASRMMVDREMVPAALNHTFPTKGLHTVKVYIPTGTVSLDYMFSGCSSLAGFRSEGPKGGCITGVSSMFNNCSSLVWADMSSLDLSGVTGASWLFYNCSSLEAVKMTGGINPELSVSSNMFTSIREGGVLYHDGLDYSSLLNSALFQALPMGYGWTESLEEFPY